ncbi:sigma-70 family RNA polymerase sigma factor [Anaerocolumna jejuensis]|uniref:sigma-70 family RNA polymerase sigma factor n=1 Tax=Anaerocolumna jejuensis TaxID=259063 RepID=UPI003F7CC5E0
MIIDVIAKIQNGDSNSTLELIEKFNPLLKKYAHMLYYEDAYNDLLADFIELLSCVRIDRIKNKDDGGMTAYIAASMHSSYVKKLIKQKQLHRFIIYSDLSENELHYIDALNATNDTYINNELDLLKNILTASEFIIIKMIFYDGYSVTETANANSITRQAVNQMKNRALKKLKLVFSDKQT